MKLAIVTFLLFFGFKQSYAQVQKLTEKQAESMLQGFWVFEADSSYSMVFSGDTIVEYHLGEATMDIIPYTLSDKGCYDDDSTVQMIENQGIFPSQTGIYILLDGDEEEGGLCATLVFPDARHVLLVIDEDKALELDKKE